MFENTRLYSTDGQKPCLDTIHALLPFSISFIQPFNNEMHDDFSAAGSAVSNYGKLSAMFY